MSLAADVRMMCTGYGSVLVRAGTVTTRGLWDDVDLEQVLGGQSLLSRRRTLVLAAAVVPALAAEDTITVGAVEDDATVVTYTVVDVTRESDGAILRVLVAA